MKSFEGRSKELVLDPGADGKPVEWLKKGTNVISRIGEINVLSSTVLEGGKGSKIMEVQTGKIILKHRLCSI